MSDHAGHVPVVDSTVHKLSHQHVVLPLVVDHGGTPPGVGSWYRQTIGGGALLAPAKRPTSGSPPCWFTCTLPTFSCKEVR